MNTTKLILLLANFLIVVSSDINAQTVNSSPSTTDEIKEVDADEFRGLVTGVDDVELDFTELQTLRKKTKVVVLDVRSQLAFDQKHIKDSINIPLTELTEHTLKKVLPDKNTNIALACDFSFYGARSRMMPTTFQAWPVMKKNGYKNVYRLNLHNILPDQAVKIYGK